MTRCFWRVRDQGYASGTRGSETLEVVLTLCLRLAPEGLSRGVVPGVRDRLLSFFFRARGTGTL